MGKKPVSIPNPPNVSCRDGAGFKEPLVRSLGLVYEKILNPPKETLDKVMKIRELASENLKEASELKKELPAFCWSGTFGIRNNAGLIEHSGRLQIDLDKLGTPEQIQEIKLKLQCDQHIEAIFLSPSGNGLKGGIIIPKAASAEEHSRHFKAVERYFKEVHDLTIDPQCKDVCRMCMTQMPTSIQMPWY